MVCGVIIRLITLSITLLSFETDSLIIYLQSEILFTVYFIYSHVFRTAFSIKYFIDIVT